MLVKDYSNNFNNLNYKKNSKIILKDLMSWGLNTINFLIEDASKTSNICSSLKLKYFDSYKQDNILNHLTINCDENVIKLILLEVIKNSISNTFEGEISIYYEFIKKSPNKTIYNTCKNIKKYLNNKEIFSPENIITLTNNLGYNKEHFHNILELYDFAIVIEDSGSGINNHTKQKILDKINKQNIPKNNETNFFEEGKLSIGFNAIDIYCNYSGYVNENITCSFQGLKSCLIFKNKYDLNYNKCLSNILDKKDLNNNINIAEIKTNSKKRNTLKLYMIDNPIVNNDNNNNNTCKEVCRSFSFPYKNQRLYNCNHIKLESNDKKKGVIFSPKGKSKMFIKVSNYNLNNATNNINQDSISSSYNDTSRTKLIDISNYVDFDLSKEININNNNNNNYSKKVLNKYSYDKTKNTQIIEEEYNEFRNSESCSDKSKANDIKPTFKNNFILDDNIFNISTKSNKNNLIKTKTSILSLLKKTCNNKSTEIKNNKIIKAQKLMLNNNKNSSSSSEYYSSDDCTTLKVSNFKNIYDNNSNNNALISKKNSFKEDNNKNNNSIEINILNISDAKESSTNLSSNNFFNLTNLKYKISNNNTNDNNIDIGNNSNINNKIRSNSLTCDSKTFKYSNKISNNKLLSLNYINPYNNNNNLTINLENNYKSSVANNTNKTSTFNSKLHCNENTNYSSEHMSQNNTNENLNIYNNIKESLSIKNSNSNIQSSNVIIKEELIDLSKSISEAINILNNNNVSKLDVKKIVKKLSNSKAKLSIDNLSKIESNYTERNRASYFNNSNTSLLSKINNTLEINNENSYKNILNISRTKELSTSKSRFSTNNNYNKINIVDNSFSYQCKSKDFKNTTFTNCIDSNNNNNTSNNASKNIGNLSIDIGIKKNNSFVCNNNSTNYIDINKKDDKREYIIIVDDCANITISVRNLLSKIIKNCKIKYEFVLLNDGSETISFVSNLTKTKAKRNIKLLITDHNMIYMNGSESIKIVNRIVQNFNLKPFSSVIISAISDSISSKESLERFNTEYTIVKPLDKYKVEYLINKFKL